MSRYLGLDYGAKRVGAALSDPTGQIVTPIDPFPLEPFRKLVGSLKALIREKEVHQIVVGIPRNMDGSYGPSAEVAQDFSRRLSEVLPIPVTTFDERLTTVQASKALRESGKNAKAQKALIDSASAQIILQTYLEHLAFRASS
ncbi:MAG: Holliday junction resolvase RuvX [Candidatus Methylacidiphilales bacterium]